jgi:hypothetical protein
MQVQPGPLDSTGLPAPRRSQCMSYGWPRRTPTAECRRIGSTDTSNGDQTVGMPSWEPSSSKTGRSIHKRLEVDSLSAMDRPATGTPMCMERTWGLSAAAYSQVGGFPPLAVAEDHALVMALKRSGSRIARPGGLPVVTSARRDPRANRGFGSLLCSMD